MEAKIFRKNEKDVADFSEAIKYWSNSLGELHHHGEYDISEDELPEDFHHAYNDLFFEGEEIGSLRYLVETEKGFGIALLNEYDQCYADDCGLSMDELFESALQDSASVAADPLFEKADVFVGEHTGFYECHEVFVVFPANISSDEFFAAAARLDELVYRSAKTFKKSSLSDKIQAAQDASSLSLDQRVAMLQDSNGYEALSHDYEVLKNTASGSSLSGITADVWLKKLSALSDDDLRSYVERYKPGLLDPSHVHDGFVGRSPLNQNGQNPER